jgi:hypothetical protein
MIRVLDAALIPWMGGQIAPGWRGPEAFSLQLLVDRIPTREERRYKTLRKPNGTLYVSLLDGVASFFHHDPSDQAGYGGAVFTGLLESGEPFSVKGPWSSGPSEVNASGLIEPVVEASATTSPKDWERGYTHYGLSGVTAGVVDQALRFLPGWRFEWPNAGVGRPAAAGNLSDQQTAAVVEKRLPGGWTYEPGFERCPGCEGAAYLPAAEGEAGAWKTFEGDWRRSCPTCNQGSWPQLTAGIVPVPGLRINNKIVRAQELLPCT